MQGNYVSCFSGCPVSSFWGWHCTDVRFGPPPENGIAKERQHIAPLGAVGAAQGQRITYSDLSGVIQLFSVTMLRFLWNQSLKYLVPECGLSCKAASGGTGKLLFRDKNVNRIKPNRVCISRPAGRTITNSLRSWWCNRWQIL